MQFLTLSIRCLLPHQLEKNCILKIHNRQLDIHIELQNTFAHNYQYVYRLWPCQLTHAHNIHLELWEKDEEGKLKLRGMAQAKIVYSHEGERYRFYGDRAEGEVFLMRFRVEKAQEDNEQSKEEAELRKINSEMEQNLQKYKEEIQNYQEFLYFTNNVIKELNTDPIKPQHEQPHQEDTPQLKQESHIKIDEQSSRVESQRAPLIQTKRKSSRAKDSQDTIRNKPNQMNQEPQQQIPQQITPQISQAKSHKSSVKSGSKAVNILSKYRYLEEEDQSKKKYLESQLRRQDTPINTLKDELSIVSPSDEKKKQKQLEISNQIKQRRQQYLIPHEQPKQTQQNENRSSLVTPINRLSSRLASKISKHSINHQNNISSAEIKEINQEEPQINVQSAGKVSTRSQTGLKQMKAKIEDKQQINEDQNESNISMSSYKKPQVCKTSEVKSLKSQKINQIIKTDTAPIEEADQSNSIEESPVSQHHSIVQNIARRRKVIAKNSASILGEIEEMNSIGSVSRYDDLRGSTVSKLVLFAIRSTFYANFKSSTKKCIIEHNGQVYETDFQKNNLKQTSWNDRIVVSALRPSEDLILMVYALRMDQVELEGTAIVSMTQILSSSEKHFKFYLYFDSIAVGSIEFDVERENKAHKRLAVSLPQIKTKSPPPLQQIASKTIRIKTNSEQYSRIQSHPSERQNPSRHVQLRRPSVNSNLEQSQLMPSNEDMTKKVRNIKMTKLLRLGKAK